MLLKESQISVRSSSLLFAVVAALLGVVAGVSIILVGNPLYVLVGLAGLLGFVVTLASLEFGLLFLFFITYTRFSDIVVHYYNAPSVAKSFIVLLIVAIFIRWAVSNDRPRGLLVPTVLVLAYGLVGFASLLYARDSDAVLYSLSNYVKDALIALVIVALLKRPQQLRQLMYTFLFIGVFISSFSVHQFLTGNFHGDYGGFAEAELMNIVGETNDFRLSGPVGDPNFFAQVMVVVVLIGVERFMHDRNVLVKMLAAACVVLSAFTVVFTYSRGATLALALTLILFFLIYKLKPAQLIAVILLGMAVFLFAPPTYFERLFSVRDILPSAGGGVDLTSDRAIQGRASESLTAWTMFAQHPFTGVGLNNYTALYQEYAKSLGLAPSARPRAPHNLYLEVAAETGVIGLVIFLLMIGLAFRGILYARKEFMKAGMYDYAHMVTGFALGFSSYMFAALFAHAAYPRYFYLLLGIAYALPQVIERLQLDKEHELMRTENLSPYDFTKLETNL
jgi:putative inorganic carbon (HCO3(-)) transporter